jgi:hypothetical protein
VRKSIEDCGKDRKNTSTFVLDYQGQIIIMEEENLFSVALNYKEFSAIFIAEQKLKIR